MANDTWKFLSYHALVFAGVVLVLLLMQWWLEGKGRK